MLELKHNFLASSVNHELLGAVPVTLEKEEVLRVLKRIQLGNSQALKCEKGGKDTERRANYWYTTVC